MKRLIVVSVVSVFIIIMAAFASAGTKSITLGWVYDSQPPDLAGFKIYQASTSGQYDMGKPALIVSDPVARQATLPNPLPDGQYYWVMTAFDKSGNESGKSPELAYALDATAPPAPGTLKIVVTVQVPQ